MDKKPAIVSGERICNINLPFVRPVLPDLKDLSADYSKIFQNGMITTGPFAEQLGKEVANYLGVKHAIAVSSCTTGLMLATQFLNLPKGSTVLIPSFTFMASAIGPVWNGFRLRFVDVDLETLNLDLGSLEDSYTPDVSAVVGVHIFGNPAPVEELMKFAGNKGIALLFDAAHGFGSLHHRKPLGGYGDAEVFSMSPTKLLIAGEGGIVATNNEDLAEHVRIGRNYGNPGNYDSLFCGMNARMSELHALCALRSLTMLEDAALQRNRVVCYYHDRLKGIPGISFQKVHSYDRCSYKDFSIRIDEAGFGVSRSTLKSALEAEGIATRVYFSPVLHRMTAYGHFSDESVDERLVNTNTVERQVLSLPLYSDMTEDEAEIVCAAVEAVHRHSGAVAALGV